MEGETLRKRKKVEKLGGDISSSLSGKEYYFPILIKLISVDLKKTNLRTLRLVNNQPNSFACCVNMQSGELLTLQLPPLVCQE